MSKKGGCRSSGNRSHKSSSSGNRSHKSKGSDGNRSSCKSSGNRSYEYKSSGNKSYECKSSGNKSHECKSSGNRSYESIGNYSSRSSGVQGVLALIGVGTPNIRIHFDGTFHTGIFLGITAGCVVVNVKGVICYIRISSITAVDVGCVEKKKRKFKCRKR